MLYKPSYCCHCGEKIERADWKPWTSRRFCDVCKVENKGYDLLARSFFGGGLILALLGVGGYLQKSKSDPGSSQKNPGLQMSKKSLIADSPSISANIKTDRGNSVDESAALPRALGEERGKQTPSSKTISEAPVFYCGAMTKKGTPCTRRVKVKGNCWQHAGRTS